jgi:hypothetical protein
VARACRIGASRSATRKQGLDGRVVRVDRFKRNEIAARNADSLILPWRNRNEAGNRAAIARDNRLAGPGDGPGKRHPDIASPITPATAV